MNSYKSPKHCVSGKKYFVMEMKACNSWWAWFVCPNCKTLSRINNEDLEELGK